MKKVISLIIAALFIQFLSAQENEPNDTPDQADILLFDAEIVGDISTTDLNDWYRFELEEGGLFEIDIRKPEVNTIFWVYLHDGEIEGEPIIQQLRMFNNDTLLSLSHQLLEGTYYIQVGTANTLISYSLTPRFTSNSWADDVEPNNDTTRAITVLPNDEFTGNILYYEAGIGNDVEDWYALKLEEGGLLDITLQKSFLNGSALWIHLLDGEIEGFPIIANLRLLNADSIHTISTHLLKGNYYILVNSASHPNTYRIQTSFTPPTWVEDSEPNNDTTEATVITLEDSITGNLSYYEAGYGHDPVDWFALEVVEEGLLTIDIFKENNDAIFWVYLRDPSQGGNPVINQRRLFNNQFTEQMKTVLVPGKYYIQVGAPSRDLEYLIHLDFIPKPKAEFNYTQVNNSVLFENLSIGGSEYLWEFGDENVSEAVNPLYEYETPRVYDACLMAINEGGVDTTCTVITIEGLDRIFPSKGGNIGMVTIAAFGGGLDTLFNIQLVQNNIPLVVSERTYIKSRNSIAAQMDLNNVMVGKYDVIIEKPGVARYEIKEGFEVVKGVQADPWVKVIGRDRILFNTWSTYTIEVGNNGNVDASVVPIWILMEEANGLEMKFSNPDLIVPDESDTYDQDDPIYINLSIEDGMPYNARVYSFIIPNIAPQQVIVYPIKIKTPQDIRMLSWAEKPWIEFVSDAQRRTNSEIVVNSNKSECRAQAIQTAAEENEFENIDIQCVFAAILAFINNIFEEPNASYIRVYARRKASWLWSCGVRDKETRRQLIHAAIVTFIIHHVKSVKTVASKQAITSTPEHSNFHTPAGMKVRAGPASSQMIDITICEKEAEMKNSTPKNLKAVNNFDPNEKVGPTGYREQNYFREAGIIPFQVYYENKDFATAPVHVLKIEDQLDVDRYDLNTFSFGRFTIADSTWYPDPGLKEYFGDYYLEEHNVVARVYGKLDTLTGKIYWEIRSLDPVTLVDVEDPDIGFLPPNKTSPEGEGMISFSVNSYEDLDHGTEIENNASIIFDANQPLVTNTYKMTLDQEAPESHVNPLSSEVNLLQFDVSWGGHDEDSGVSFYDIYYSIDQDTFQLWLYHTPDTLATFYGEANTSYQFYSIAYDQVGNVEEAPSTWDAETFISTSTHDDGQLSQAIHLYPNPCYGTLNVELDFNNTDLIKWSISNAIGTTVMKPTTTANLRGDRGFDVNLSHLPGGVYFLNICVEDRYVTRKFVLIN